MQGNAKEVIRDSYCSLKDCVTSLEQSLNVLDGDKRKNLKEALEALNSACRILSQRVE